MSYFYKIWIHLTPKRKLEAYGVLFLSAATALSELLFLYIIYIYINTLLSPDTKPRNATLSEILTDILGLDTSRAVYIVILVLATTTSLRLISSAISNRLCSRIGHELSIRPFTLLPNISPRKVQALEVDAVYTIMSKGIDHIVTNVIFPNILLFSSATIIFVMLLGASFVFNPIIIITIIAATILPLSIVMLLVRKRLKHYSILINSGYSASNIRLRHAIEGYKHLIISGNYASFLLEFSNTIRNLRDGVSKSNFYGALPRTLIEAAAYSALLFGLLVVPAINSDGPGGMYSEYLACGLFALRLLPFFGQVFSAQSSLKFGAEFTKRYFDFLKCLHRQADWDGQKPVERSGILQGSSSEIYELRICNLRLNTPDRIVQYPPDLRFSRGRMYFLSGPSGSGKTTLLDVIAGLHMPNSECNIFVNSTKVDLFMETNWHRSVRYQGDWDFIQRGTIYDHFGRSGITRIELVDRYLEVVGLADSYQSSESRNEGKYVATKGSFYLEDAGLNLSAGQKSRLGLAVSLAQGKDILILDEVFSTIDRKRSIEIIKYIRTHLPHTITIFTTHDLSFSDYADEVICLS